MLVSPWHLHVVAKVHLVIEHPLMAIIGEIFPTFRPFHRFHDHSINVTLDLLHPLFALSVLDLHRSRVQLNQVYDEQEVQQVRNALQHAHNQVPLIVVFHVMVIGLEDLIQGPCRKEL